MKSSRLHGLYAITDSLLIPEDDFETAITQSLQGGARIIQYRDKTKPAAVRLAQSQLLRRLCDEYNALLIINDDIDLTIASKADGVHLGKGDASIKTARKKLGAESIIGQSCYNDVDSAINAQTEGATYVAFGAFFSSPTKPDAKTVLLTELQRAKQELTIPICTIGGITVDNAPSLINAGADMVAVISGIFAQANIKQVSKNLASLF